MRLLISMPTPSAFRTTACVLAILMSLVCPAYADIDPIHIVHFGDSITDASPHIDGLMETELRAYYGTNQIFGHNCAKGGRDVSEFMATPNGWYATNCLPVYSQIDYCFIQFGINDEDAYGPDEFKMHLTNMCDTIESDYPGVKIILCTSVQVKSPSWWASQPPGAEEPISINYYSKTRELAAERGYPLVDIYQITVDEILAGRWDFRISATDMHPTARGIQLFADAEVELLKSLPLLCIGKTIFVDNQLADDCPGGNYSIANRDGSGSDGIAYNTLPEAAAAVEHCDTVYIRQGTYTVGDDGILTMFYLADIESHETGGILVSNYNGESVIFDGGDFYKYGVLISKCKWVRVTGLEFQNMRWCGVSVHSVGVVGGASQITIEHCEAHDCGVSELVQAFRIVGPARYVNFSNLISYNNGIGIGWEEKPGMGKTVAWAPPVAGNIDGYTADLPEADWDAWEGWTQYAARYCTIENCLAFDNMAHEENSDGIATRYAVDSVVQDNICFRNADDNFDMPASVRMTFRRNISFDADPLNTAAGDGNGVKFGVWGGLDNVLYRNLCFDNPRCGIETAYAERSGVYNNTCYNNGTYGIYNEASRAAVYGSEFINNICQNNNHDMSHYVAALISRADYNSISDANNQAGSYSQSVAQGPNSMISTDAMLADQSLMIDTNFPAGMSIPEKHAYIRDQVVQKLALASGSPCISAGDEIPGVTDGFKGPAPEIGALELILPPAQIVGRHIFYNNSYFDGDDPAANASDDGAIAPDKTPLLTGQTGAFANYTSYSRGINGIIIDITNLAGPPDAGDFEVRVGNDWTPGSWPAGPAPISVTVRSGAGGSDRITLIWADNAIEKQWMQLTVKATANTGLLSDDTFYFGNAIGETGNSTFDAEVSAWDIINVRNNPHTLGVNPAAITEVCDFNRDRKVTPTDAILVRNNGTSMFTALQLITVP